MRKVYKYTLKPMDIQNVRIPKDSSILCVENQYDEPVLYVEVDSAVEELETIQIAIVGTGHTLPEKRLMYLGTVITFTDTLVWHIYKVLG